MYQLIVGVSAMSLVVALALASIFYGGEAFTRAREKAQSEAHLKKGDVERVDTSARSSILPSGGTRWIVTDSY
jgi:uncharacterized protein (DUF2235 family)